MTDVTRAGRREWLGLAALALPALLTALDIGVLFLALPQLSVDLDASSTQQLWITDIYGFLLAGLLITMGTLGDRIGRRRLLLIGAAGFGVASVLAAYSTSAEMLIAARALLGLAGATLGPSTLALISNMFRDGKQRGLAISIWGTCQFAGAALGPVIGGVLIAHFWWGSVFLAGVPVMVLLLVVGPKVLPEYRDERAGRLDLPSVALSLAAVLPVVYGIKQFAVGGNGVVAIAAGTIAGVVFVRRQFTLDDPLLNLGLFRIPAVRIALPAMMAGSFALAGMGLMSSQYVQTVLGLDPGTAGLWQAPTGLGIALGVLLSPVAVSRLKPYAVIAAGLAVSCAGLLLLTRIDADTGALPVALAVAAVAFGVGPLFALGTGIVVGGAPPERAGSAAAMSETSNLLGSTLGLAVLGSIGAAVFRRGVPGGPETVAAAAQHDETAGAARDAFTDGLNVVAGVGAVIMFVLVIVAVTRLRAVSGETSGTDVESAESAPTTS